MIARREGRVTTWLMNRDAAQALTKQFTCVML